MSEIFVAGDIHGNYQGLMESLNAAGWQEGDTISPKSGFIMFIRTDGLVKTNLCQGIQISQQSAVVPIR